MFVFLLAAAQAATAEPGPPTSPIVITASRIPQELPDTPASVTLIDRPAITRLGEPLVTSLLRLVPSAAVETSGPAGSFAEVRIRGAEANHTLLFIDGIRVNDPAANDTPRFELLNADVISRVEVVRGPQSALWGSDAIGGVIAVNGVAERSHSPSLTVEAGSLGFARAATSAALAGERAAVSGALAWQLSSGIDSFDGSGDRDGYRNFAARLRGTYVLGPNIEAGAAALALRGRSEFDGIDLLTFIHGDTLDSSRNRLSAGRLWLSAGNADRLSGTVATSLLDSSNRNFLGEDEINRTSGRRWDSEAQVQYRFATGLLRHTAIVALDHDRETFTAADTIYFGASNQRRSRSHDAITAELRSEAGPLAADLAVRHDAFSAFADATTIRASGLVGIGGGFAIAASYAEGIAQPTFFDLYGFFPGTFIGNPLLKPESSRGFEASLRYRVSRFEAALTAYRQRLRDEIVDLFDPVTFRSSTANRDAASRRSGIEAEAAWRPSPALRLSANYAFLHATEPGAVPTLQLREVRRPKHSASLAIDGTRGRLTYGASIAYVGARGDTNFDVFPAQKVHLGSYWLAGGRIAYAVRPNVQLFGRVSNLFDTGYQDVFGYRTEGRGLFAGIRVGAD